jgi:hypothetical protein
MLNIIKTVYNRFFPIPKKSVKDKNLISNSDESIDKQDSYIADIRFELTDNEDIDISYIVPNLENKSLEDLSILAEKYAKFLMAINEGYLREDLVKIITDKTKKSDNPQDHLFWDNVMVYWGMCHVEALKNKRYKEKTDQPLVRPLSVFNSSEN